MAFQCKKCAECCQRYWITLLPEEAKKQAAFLGQSLEQFVQKNCILFLQVFPTHYLSRTLSLSRSFFPKHLSRKLSEKNIVLPEIVTILPWLALKRENKACVFLDKEKLLCRIHQAKPAQCSLFPFISLRGEKNFSQLYPFCQGLKPGLQEKDTEAKRKAHLDRIKAYFKEVKRKGFQSLWKHLPEKGKLFFQDDFICDLNRKEFFQAIAPFK